MKLLTYLEESRFRTGILTARPDSDEPVVLGIQDAVALLAAQAARVYWRTPWTGPWGVLTAPADMLDIVAHGRPGGHRAGRPGADDLALRPYRGWWLGRRPAPRPGRDSLAAAAPGATALYLPERQYPGDGSPAVAQSPLAGAGGAAPANHGHHRAPRAALCPRWRYRRVRYGAWRRHRTFRPGCRRRHGHGTTSSATPSATIQGRRSSARKPRRSGR